mmetsp:Transcript_24797/g.69462  ORF Transcript_24797/g.69462 Transcript_24797/m.69462 type:complete len:213 (-) Transcript_24797:487-1125(-)
MPRVARRTASASPENSKPKRRFSDSVSNSSRRVWISKYSLYTTHTRRRHSTGCFPSFTNRAPTMAHLLRWAPDRRTTTSHSVGHLYRRVRQHPRPDSLHSSSSAEYVVRWCQKFDWSSSPTVQLNALRIAPGMVARASSPFLKQSRKYLSASFPLSLAKSNGVFSNLSFARTSALFSTNNFIISTAPVRAATWRGVFPSLSVALTFASFNKH